MFACLNSFSFIVFVIAIIIVIIIISSARAAREGEAEGHERKHREEAALPEGTDGMGRLG